MRIAGTIESARPRSEFAHWSVLFVLFCALFALRAPLHGNELETLVFARVHADPAFLNGDWFFSQPAVSRLPAQIVLWPVVHALPLTQAALLTRLAGYAWLSFGLARIAGRLGLRISESALALGAFVYLNQSIAAGEWIIGTFESKVIAYGFVFLALAALIDGKVVLCAVCAALAAVFEPLVGGAASVALLASAAAVPQFKDSGWRAAGAWLVLTVPAAMLLSMSVADAPFTQVARAADISVFFRNPHHTDPFFFLRDWYAYALLSPALAYAAEMTLRVPRVRGIAVLLAAPALIAAYASSRSLGNIVALPVMLWILLRAVSDRSGSRTRRILGTFSLASFALFYAGLLAALLPGGALLLQAYPFRLADSLVLLFSLMLGVRMLSDLRSVATTDRVVTAASAAVMLWGMIVFVSTIRHGTFRVDHPTVFTWIRTHTPAAARVLVSPAIAHASLDMHRATVVQFKFFPYTVKGINEWYRRLADMSGGEVPPERDFAAERAIDARFVALTPAQYESLARRYGAAYLVLPRTRSLPLRRLYAGKNYSVYSVPRH